MNKSFCGENFFNFIIHVERNLFKMHTMKFFYVQTLWGVIMGFYVLFITTAFWKIIFLREHSLYDMLVYDLGNVQKIRMQFLI
jgi:hypothetical protein